MARGHAADPRRERPHPGAQFCVFDAHGYRHTAVITDQDGSDIAALELRHRRHAHYLKSADYTLRGENGGSRLVVAFARLRALPAAAP